MGRSFGCIAASMLLAFNLAMGQDEARFDSYGRSVDVHADLVIVGAPLEDQGRLTNGTVYIHDLAEGSGTVLSASDAASGDRFGQAVALTGDFAAVGAVRDDFGAEVPGAVYVYEAPNWNESARLVPSSISSSAAFGFAVDATSEYIVVGAPIEVVDGVRHGAVHVFALVAGEWSHAARLVPPDGSEFDYFGHSVAISARRIAVGAYSDDEAASGAGAVYVFERGDSEWAFSAKLMAEDAGAGDGLGRSASLDGDLLVGGAPDDDPLAGSSGSAYAFEYGDAGWMQIAKLVPADGSQDDEFGRSVAVADDRIAVGAPGMDAEGRANTGGVYVIHRNVESFEWSGPLRGDAPHLDDHLGESLSMTESRIVAGRVFSFKREDRGGGVDVFEFAGAGWSFTRALAPPHDPSLLAEVRISTTLGARSRVIAIHENDVFVGGRSGVNLFRVDGKEHSMVGYLPNDGSSYGDGLALDGTFLYVGEPNYFRSDGARGIVRTYNYSERPWRTAGLVTPDSAVSQFGQSIEVSGDGLMVGSDSHVHFFRWNGEQWEQVARFAAAERNGMDMDGNWAVAGVSQVGFEPGAAGVIVYRRSGTAWDADTTLTFGESTMRDVALSDSMLVVSAGAFVYTFTLGADGRWNRTTEFQRQQDDFSPGVVDLDGDVLIVGERGIAFVYRFSDGAWRPDGSRRPLDASYSRGDYGAAVAIDDGTMAVWDRNQSNQVTAYVYNVDAVDTATDVALPAGPAVRSVDMQNYPNPFRDLTTITFDVEDPRTLHVYVYDVLGRRVATLLAGRMASGRTELEFTARDLAPGVYTIVLEGEGLMATRQLVLVR